MSAQQEWQVRIKEPETALEKLPVHYREAIVLVVVLEESYAHAAEILGKTALGKICPAIDGLVEEVLEYFSGSESFDTGLIATAQAVEHYETARYGPISVRPSEL